MSELLYAALGLAVGVAIGAHLRQPSSARCCQQLEQLVRADVRKRCGAAGDLCERVGGALGLFGNSSALLDLAGVTT